RLLVLLPVALAPSPVAFLFLLPPPPSSSLFPYTTLFRSLSSDLITSIETMRAELTEIAEGRVDLIIGTQLVAKGHNFPRLNLVGDRKSTRLNSSHVSISYAVFCLKKKNEGTARARPLTLA